MKLIIVAALALVATAAAAPTVTESAKLLESTFDKNIDNSYQFKYVLDNGNERNEVGELKQAADLEDPKIIHTVVAVRGTYSQLDSEGKPHLMEYVADENGYRVKGDFVPTA